MTPEQIAHLITEYPDEYRDLPGADQFGPDYDEIRRTQRYGDFTVRPFDYGWEFFHDEYDGAPDGNRWGGHGRTLEDAMAWLLELEQDIAFQRDEDERDTIEPDPYGAVESFGAFQDMEHEDEIEESYEGLPDEDEFEPENEEQMCDRCQERLGFATYNRCFIEICDQCGIPQPDWPQQQYSCVECSAISESLDVSLDGPNLQSASASEAPDDIEPLDVGEPEVDLDSGDEQEMALKTDLEAQKEAEEAALQQQQKLLEPQIDDLTQQIGDINQHALRGLSQAQDSSEALGGMDKQLLSVRQLLQSLRRSV